MPTPRTNAVWFAVSFMFMSSTDTRGQDAPNTRVLVANVEPSNRLGRELLGKPVLVSRSDVARVRGGAIPDNPVQAAPPVADPAFKAVLLTPRESTGRPVQIGMPALPDEPVAGPSVAQPNTAAKPPVSLPPAASLNPSAPASVESTPGSAPKAHVLPNPVSRSRLSPHPAVARSETASRRKAIEPPARTSYGAAEIAASRAFTRF